MQHDRNYQGKQCPSVMFFNSSILDLISDMKLLSSFLKSSWKFLMFFAFFLMAGYALYYAGTFRNSELSDIWQSELTLTHPTVHTISYKSIYTTMAILQMTKEANLTTQAVRVDTFNTTKSTDPKYLVPLTEQRPQCNVSGIKSWEHGVVTQFFPLIKRNCSNIVAGSQSEVYHVRQQLKVWKNEESDVQFVQRMNSCVNVTEEFSNNFYVSSEEQDFPLAFIFVVYTNARQVVRLLKAIYRPHNVYCIHPDARQGEEFACLFQQISKCLDNVFVASKLERVYYGHHSIMDAQLNCMKDLTEYDRSRWRYVINLVGRELPLQTNRHIVKLLKQANNVSIVESQPIGKSFFGERFRYKIGVNDRTGRLYRKQEKLAAIPHGIKIYKGSTHFALTRQFAHFILTNQKAIDFRQYLNDVWIPEESFYASLYQLFWLTKSEIQGGHSNSVTPPISYIEVSIWLAKLSPSDVLERCSGFKRHAVCIVATGDLHRVYEFGVNKDFFFFNKYFMEVDHVIMDCMEERLVKQNMLEYARDVDCLLPSEVTSH